MDFFIVGFPRSGTTLLATLIGRHSDVFVPPETRFYEEIYPKIRRVMKNGSGSIDNIKELLSKGRMPDLDSSISFLSDGVCNDVPGCLTSLVLNSGYYNNEKVIGEKSPIHLAHIDEIIKDYPAAKMIVITRRFGECLVSLQKTPWALWSDLRYALEYKYRYSLAVSQSVKYPDRFHFVRFEDLVNNPEREINKVMEVLGLVCEDGQFDPDNKTSTVPVWEEGWKNKVRTNVDQRRGEVSDEGMKYDKKYALLLNGIYDEMGYDKPEYKITIAGIMLKLKYYLFKITYGARKFIKYYIYYYDLEKVAMRNIKIKR